MDFPDLYAGDYKKLVILPLALILLSLFFIPKIPAGVELKGGILITIQTNERVVDEAELEANLRAIGVKEVSIEKYPNPTGVVLEAQISQNDRLASAETSIKQFFPKYEDASRLEPFVQELERLQASGRATQDDLARLALYKSQYDSEKADLYVLGENVLRDCEELTGPIPRNYSDLHELDKIVRASFSKAKETYRAKVLQAIPPSLSHASYSFNDVSPSLSSFFLQKAVSVVIFAAVLSMVVVFIVFRSVIPSVAVLTGAASDIIIAMGAMGLFGIPLTLSSFAALLMLIGFSLDTDVLLTIRTLKRSEGTARQRARETMKTGVTMSLAALTVFASLLLLSFFVRIPTYYQIAAVAVCGLIGDIIATWFFNAPIVLWYIERKGGK
ncbi:hypothetical protein HY992_00610 [Candidatus Micrarchaeota archaeon]|nr:hypothetical protein [Candidatus Micrarchaeota archaeon]